MRTVGEGFKFRIYRPGEYGLFSDCWVVIGPGEYESTTIAIGRDQGAVVNEVRQFVRDAQTALGALRAEIAEAQPVPTDRPSGRIPRDAGQSS